jgi:hypothetical protein
MEHIQSIEEHIAAEMGGKIACKHNSILAPLLVLCIGIGLLVLMTQSHLSDALSSACLTVGLIASAVGLILTAMNLSGALCHYTYVSTGSRMKDHKVYLTADDYRKAVDALSEGDTATLSDLHPVNSSNCALRILSSTDGSIALMQPMRDESGHLAPDAPVKCIVGTEVAHIKSLCK